jgi:hypothetical protein
VDKTGSVTGLNALPVFMTYSYKKVRYLIIYTKKNRNDEGMYKMLSKSTTGRNKRES